MAKAKSSVKMAMQCPHCRNLAFGIDGPVGPNTRIYEVRRIYGKRPAVSKPYPFCQHCYGNTNIPNSMLAPSRWLVKDVEEWITREENIARGYGTLKAAGIPSKSDAAKLAKDLAEDAEEIGGTIVTDNPEADQGAAEPEEDAGDPVL